MPKLAKGVTPVTVVAPQKTLTERIPTRLGTPSAFLMLVGLALLYVSLHGWDKKYGTFNGAFAGKGTVPTGTKKQPAASGKISVNLPVVGQGTIS